MVFHQNEKCPMTVLACNECKENVLRRDKNKHDEELCPERACDCPFKKYGCDEIIKRKLLDDHLVVSEAKHLRLKVKHVLHLIHFFRINIFAFYIFQGWVYGE